MTTQPSKDQQFFVGEVVICLAGTISKGRDATILSIEPNANRSDGRTGLGYYVDIEGVGAISHNGLRICLFADEIKRKPQPREDLQIVRWDTCPWQPEELRV